MYTLDINECILCIICITYIRFDYVQPVYNRPKLNKITHRSGNASESKKSKQWSIENAVRAQYAKNRLLVDILEDRAYLQDHKNQIICSVSIRKRLFFFQRYKITLKRIRVCLLQQLQSLLRQVNKPERESRKSFLRYPFVLLPEPKEEAHLNLV